MTKAMTKITDIFVNE